MTDQRSPTQPSVQKSPNHSSLIALLLVMIFGFICIIVFIIRPAVLFPEPTNTPTPLPLTPPTPVLTVDNTLSNPNLNVSVSIIDTVCLDADHIDYSDIELSIDGGMPPYDLTVANSKNELAGPYLIAQSNFPVRFKVYGGDHFTASVRSKADEFWSSTIGLPFEAEYCKNSYRPPLERPDTEVALTTPIPVETEITIAFTPSDTQIPVVSPTNLTAVASPPTRVPPKNTKTSHPERTNTVSPYTLTSSKTPSKTPDPTHPQHTDTSHPSITDTPRSPATNTSRPAVTDTPRPPATNTPRPAATDTTRPPVTNTSRPPATDTPRPPATNTSAPPPTVIIPNPKECEDGIDNDGDELIDMADPQCTRPGDPHEGH